MIVVLPVCQKDEHLALLNLELCIHFGDGPIEYDCLITCDSGFNPDRVIGAAKQYFHGVFLYRYSPNPWGDTWPKPQNWAWQQSARGVQGFRQDAWLWWEPDAVPLKRGWVGDIAQGYQQGGKLFGGCVVNGGVVPTPYLAGVAVYPPNLQVHAPHGLNQRNMAFDLAISMLDGVLVKTHNMSSLIHHEFRPDGGGWEVGDPIPSGALYHRCKNGELQNALKVEQVKPVNGLVFYDCGDLGDTLYKLPTIKAMGGGKLFLGKAQTGKVFGLREPMTEARAGLLIPLLEQQEYIREAKYAEVCSPSWIDLGQMRRWHYPPIGDPSLNLVDRCSIWYTHKRDLWKSQWISCQPNKIASVVINRTRRWQGFLDWARIVKMFGKSSVFLGTPDEHSTFCERYGKVAYHKTTNLLEAAQVIGGADLFCGNQSACYAIAEGMKKPTILEVCHRAQDCQFPRKDRFESVEEYVTATTKSNSTRN